MNPERLSEHKSKRCRLARGSACACQFPLRRPAAVHGSGLGKRGGGRKGFSPSDSFEQSHMHVFRWEAMSAVNPCLGPILRLRGPGGFSAPPVAQISFEGILSLLYQDILTHHKRVVGSACTRLAAGPRDVVTRIARGTVIVGSPTGLGLA